MEKKRASSWGQLVAGRISQHFRDFHVADSTTLRRNFLRNVAGLAGVGFGAGLLVPSRIKADPTTAPPRTASHSRRRTARPTRTDPRRSASAVFSQSVVEYANRVPKRQNLHLESGVVAKQGRQRSKECRQNIEHWITKEERN